MNTHFWLTVCVCLTSLTCKHSCQVDGALKKNSPLTTAKLTVPKNLAIVTMTSTSIKVNWTLLQDVPEPGAYTYTVCARPTKSSTGVQICCYTNNDSSCTVPHLDPDTAYNLTIDACSTSSTTECSKKSDPLIIDALPNAPDNRLMKILLGVFIPLIIIIIILILLFVFRRRIPCLRGLFKNESSDLDSSFEESVSSALIEYYNPPGPKSLSNIPPPIPLEKFAANLQELNSNNGFQILFKEVEALSKSEIEDKYHLTNWVARENRSRNRYGDMVPYDQSLVLLGRPWSTAIGDSEPRITVGEAGKGYINASYVRRPEYGSRGEALVALITSLPEYIATQGPRENTVADFLTMVCEQRCPLIIMLSECNENGKEKCAQYWPDEAAKTFHSPRCSVEVRKESDESSGNIIRRQLKIHPSGEQVPWTVTQFQFTGWADYNAPNMQSLHSFINEQNNFLATHHVGNEYGPVVVHCSAGMGRTGTFMAAVFLLDRLRKNPQNVDIVGTVLAMRKWRANLVQVWPQFQFLYNFINFCLEKEKPSVKQTTLVAKSAPSTESENTVKNPPLNAAQPAEYENIAKSSQLNAAQRGEYRNPPSSYVPAKRPAAEYENIVKSSQLNAARRGEYGKPSSSYKPAKITSDAPPVASRTKKNPA